MNAQKRWRTLALQNAKKLSNCLMKNKKHCEKEKAIAIKFSRKEGLKN
jgi:hypothetical protein